MRIPKLDDRSVVRLAAEGGYVCNAAHQEHYSYDISGYQRVRRVETKFGKFKALTIEEQDGKGIRKNELVRRPRSTYLCWLSGFHRGRAFGPADAGRTLAAAGIGYTDGPGNGLLESAVICSNFGIRMMFQLPNGTSSKCYTRRELSALSKDYGRALDDEVVFLSGLGRITGRNYISDRDMLWVLVEHGDIDPLGLFLANYRRDPRGVVESFEAKTRRRLSFRQPRTNEGRIGRAELWEYVRVQFNRIMAIKAAEVRRRIAGRIASNIHFDAPLQYGSWGKIFDIPCIGIRPLIVNDPDVWYYWVGYATRLVGDATGKVPAVSIRANLAAVGSRRIPTASTIRFWHSQAIQNGVRGFSFWTLDFPGDLRDPRAYFGPLHGNPDHTTLPEERWTALLEISRQLKGQRIFLPPRSDVAVFVNLFGSLQQNWRRIFQTYCALASKKIFCNFVTDENILNKQTKLSAFKLLILPELGVIRARVLDSFYQFLQSGGAILLATTGKVISDKTEREPDRFLQVLPSKHKLRSRPRRVVVRDGKALVLAQGSICYTFPKGVPTVGSYSDRENHAAIINLPVGEGRIQVAGFDLFTVTRRTTLAQYLENYVRLCGCRNLSWVFDITIESIANTGANRVPSKRRKGVQIPHYLYAHDESP